MRRGTPRPSAGPPARALWTATATGRSAPTILSHGSSWRYSGSPAATSKELYFNDTDEISGYALEALRWAVENGILNGYGDGRLGPQGQATRAQVAQMLKNFIESQEKDA